MIMTIAETAALSQAVIAEVEKAVIGKHRELEMLMASLLSSGGHILLEDFPGLAKTLIANSFATALGMSFKRIQFTPDLLPGDITGGYIYDRQSSQFVLRKGPLFANLILADEINRASPRTQSALLEAMQEYQVTVETETVRLGEPFVVIATQNPIEYEGTFPLPEAQLDRFLVKLPVGYPSAEDEFEILTRRMARKQDGVDLQAVTSAEGLLAMRLAVEEVFVDPDLQKYIVSLVARTRQHRKIAIGASPRASLAFVKLARAWAAMQGRSYILPDDIKRFAQAVLGHRIILEPDQWTVHKAAQDVITDVLNSVPVPVAAAGR